MVVMFCALVVGGGGGMASHREVLLLLLEREGSAMLLTVSQLPVLPSDPYTDSVSCPLWILGKTYLHHSLSLFLYDLRCWSLGIVNSGPIEIFLVFVILLWA